MFTLKLYKRTSPEMVITKVLSCHHIETLSFQHMDEDIAHHRGLEIRAFEGPEPSHYLSFLIGDETKHVLYAGPKPPSPDWWGWGLLENAAGKTTEHFRPAGYG